ncbi:hypothetical protein WAI453_009625 [Rhynchosporium graminicola]
MESRQKILSRNIRTDHARDYSHLIHAKTHILATQNRQIDRFQAHLDWQTTSSANEILYQCIMAVLIDQISFVQGLPGTGKSDVACTETLCVACLEIMF